MVTRFSIIEECSFVRQRIPCHISRRIAGICFKTGPPQHRRRLGAETEWIVVDPVDEAVWEPVDRERTVSRALQVYASLAQSADKGAARRV